MGRAVTASGMYANYDVTLGEAADSPAGVAAGWLLASLETVWEAGVYAWALLPVLAARTLSAPSTWLALGAAGAAFILTWFALRQADFAQPFSAGLAWPFAAILIGLAGLVLGRVPRGRRGCR